MWETCTTRKQALQCTVLKAPYSGAGNTCIRYGIHLDSLDTRYRVLSLLGFCDCLLKDLEGFWNDLVDHVERHVQTEACGLLKQAVTDALARLSGCSRMSQGAYRSLQISSVYH